MRVPLQQLLAAEEELMEDNDSASVDEVIDKFFDAGEGGATAADAAAALVVQGNRGSSVS